MSQSRDTECTAHRQRPQANDDADYQAKNRRLQGKQRCTSLSTFDLRDTSVNCPFSLQAYSNPSGEQVTLTIMGFYPKV